jgi:hypothetical protein
MAAIASVQPNFTSPAVGSAKKFDVPDALLQFIEHRGAPLDERLAILRRLDALRAAVEQAYAERIFKIGDDFRHSRLRDAKLLRRLRHAAVLDRRVKHVQVAQLEPATDLAFPVDPSGHGIVL